MLAVAGLLHVYWAFGGRWGLEAASPVDPSRSAQFTPGRALTLLVAAALFVASALVAAVAWGTGFAIARWLTVAAAAVFALRAVGDARVAGFTKTIRGTEFAEADDRLFTPLCVFLSLGTTAALLI